MIGGTETRGSWDAAIRRAEIERSVAMDSQGGHPFYFVDTLLTTPWIGWEPKCVVASPEYTRVTFE